MIHAFKSRVFNLTEVSYNHLFVLFYLSILAYTKTIIRLGVDG